MHPLSQHIFMHVAVIVYKRVVATAAPLLQVQEMNCTHDNCHRTQGYLMIAASITGGAVYIETIAQIVSQCIYDRTTLALANMILSFVAACRLCTPTKTYADLTQGQLSQY
jgi:hypothetical protein